ncbi:MAG TPA: amidohydrolase family protein [Gemmatimonadaceae bacterium]|nr:amidohydrolase family protein [Gemmatimonadaceae bacterium]
MTMHLSWLPNAILLVAGLLPAVPACAQDRAAEARNNAQERPAPQSEMSFEEYDPRSTLVVPKHPVARAKYPFIDVHNHQFRAAQMTAADVDSLVAAMDRLNMAVMVNLSGGSGDRLAQGVRALKGRYPKRFVVFANLDYANIDDPEWGARAAAQLERDVRQGGAQGLKIYKQHGLELKDGRGRRIPTDDPRFDPVWRKAGELGIPVLIHTGEPSEFFQPQDRHNERWLELKQFPGRARPPDRYPSWEQVMSEQHRAFARHRNTRFIAAHLDWMGSDLARLGRLLDTLPNVSTEIGAVLAEFGRQPRFAREWFIKYQDRVMFGKDVWAEEEYPYYFRTLETADEYFDYYRKRHAFWKLYGLDLPDSVLRKLYYENAMKVIPGIDRSVIGAGR